MNISEHLGDRGDRGDCVCHLAVPGDGGGDGHIAPLLIHDQREGVQPAAAQDTEG